MLNEAYYGAFDHLKIDGYHSARQLKSHLHIIIIILVPQVNPVFDRTYSIRYPINSLSK